MNDYTQRQYTRFVQIRGRRAGAAVIKIGTPTSGTVSSRRRGRRPTAARRVSREKITPRRVCGRLYRRPYVFPKKRRDTADARISDIITAGAPLWRYADGAAACRVHDRIIRDALSSPRRRLRREKSRDPVFGEISFLSSPLIPKTYKTRSWR